MRFFTILTAFALTAATTTFAADSAPQLASRAGTGLPPNNHMRMHRRVIKASEQQQQQERAAASPLQRSPVAVAAARRPAAAFLSKTRRQTQDQLDAAAKLKAENEVFHQQNAAWQAAAVESLKQGKTPLDFDAFVASQGGTTSPGDDDDDDDDDEDINLDDDIIDDEDHDGEDDDDEDVTPSADDADVSVSAKNPNNGPTSETQTEPGSKPAAVAPPKKAAGKKQKDDDKDGKPKPKEDDDNSGSGSGASLSGEGTWYNMAGGYTACGQMYSDNDMVVALSHSLFDTKTPNGNPNNNAFCGKKLRATYKGKSVVVTAVDRCAGCAYGDLDFTPTAFSKLADMGVGRLQGITWQWL